MFVKDRMSSNLVTTTESTPIVDAGEVMRKNGFARMPVVRDGKLVGIITREDLLKVSPSAATSLSVWELNYVLSKLTVKDAMTKEPVTIDSEATIEEAALLMRTRDIGALPVVDAGKLVGLITESDIFDAFVDMMGLKDTGTRLVVDIEDRVGGIANLTEIIKEQGLNIISLAIFHRRSEYAECVVRLESTQSEPLVQVLTAKGYRVLHVTSFNS
jgi:acetoin utilization protein AcuB